MSKIAIFITATGKYVQFIRKLINSSEKHFLRDHKKTYFVFSDNENVASMGSMGAEIMPVRVRHAEWPHSTMNRCTFYAQELHYQENWLKTEYSHFFAIDADAYFVQDVKPEILSALIGVEHCAYVNRPGPFENNPQSACFVAPQDRIRYYGGGFYGGNFKCFSKLNRSMSEAIQKDLNAGIIPSVHDESALNMMFSMIHPSTILSPSFHWPEHGPDLELNPYVARLWDEESDHIRKFYNTVPPFLPKMVIVDKFQGDPTRVNKLRDVDNFVP